MGCPFKSLACSVRTDGARVLTWTMKPGATLGEDYVLDLECSRAGGPWEVLAEGISGTCCWVDTRKRNYNKRLDECYRLRLKDPDRDCQCVSEIVNAGNYRAFPYSPEAENIVKQVGLAVKASGCRGSLLKRKTWGPRCPDCVDFDGQATVNEHCPRCLGTGIDGGYFPGIRLDIIKDSIQAAESPSPMGYLQGETVRARCIAYPWIGRGDVWVEDGTDRRYVVKGATPAASYRQTALVYVLELCLVERSDVLHDTQADRLVEMTGTWADPSEEPERPCPDEDGTLRRWEDVLNTL